MRDIVNLGCCVLLVFPVFYNIWFGYLLEHSRNDAIEIPKKEIILGKISLAYLNYYVI